MDATPIHLDEKILLGRHSMDPTRVPDICRYLSRNDSWARFREGTITRTS